MKTIKIELLQGENAPLVFSAEVESNKMNEIAGTLAFRILKLREKARKYKMNIGFSFARKFDVKISVDGESIDGTQLHGLSTIKFGLTVQSNDASYKQFHGFIGELVEAVLTGESALEGSYNELKNELEFGASVSKGAKQFLAAQLVELN